MFNARLCAGVLVVILALPVAAAAQVTTADIVGRVTDSSGAVLPGATVTIENLATHDVRTAPTNETGDYLFNLLPIGTYTVNVELQGFASQTTRVVLSTGEDRKSTRLNSSHEWISYAVFCLKKKKKNKRILSLCCTYLTCRCANSDARPAA